MQKFDEILTLLRSAKQDLSSAEDERVSRVRDHGIATVAMNNAAEKCKQLSGRVKELEKRLLECVSQT